MLSPPPPSIAVSNGLTGGGTGYALSIQGQPYTQPTTYGAIGTYFLAVNDGNYAAPGNVAFLFGTNYTNIPGFLPAGTWRCMGGENRAFVAGYLLFLRIS